MSLKQLRIGAEEGSNKLQRKVCRAGTAVHTFADTVHSMSVNQPWRVWLFYINAAVFQ